MSHHKASDYIDHCQNDGYQSQQAAEARFFVACSDDRTDYRDSTDRIGAAHQWRVKSRRNLGNDFKTDKDREHKHG